MSDCPFTMEDIRMRCWSCEKDECWEWRGTFLHDGRRPVLSKRMDTPKGRTNKQFYAKHVVLWIKRGKRPELGLFKAIVASCENPVCVNPDHLKVVSRSSVVRKVASAGAYSTTAHRQKIAQGRRKNSKLTDEAVMEIRATEDAPSVVAVKYGISEAYVYMIRRGEYRQDFSNPFSGLLASNDSRKAA